MPTLDNSYFAKDGTFKKKYGVFADPTMVGEHLTSLINMRQPQAINEFESNLSVFINALKEHPEANKEFFKMLDNLRAFGLVQMALRRAKDSEYHTTEHAAELADDVEKVLTQKFKDKAYSSEQIANQFMINMAKAAASWHDIIQDRGAPPNNEVDSANEFVSQLENMLSAFKIKYNFMTAAVDSLTTQLPFMARELIVFPTWLVFGMEPGFKLVAKTLNERAIAVVEDLNTGKSDADKLVMGTGPLTGRLYEAVESISTGDTKRFSLEHVRKSQQVLNAFNTYPANAKQLMQNFFDLVDIKTNEDKEEFLGLLCQNIRIFPELNKPQAEKPDQTEISKSISTGDHDSFVAACDSIKASPRNKLEPRLSLVTHAMFNNFINVENHQGKSNISREISFAKAQQDVMWDRHAQRLEAFEKYILSISIPDKDAMAEMLITLATRYQPGCDLLKHDKAFHAQLKEIDKWQQQIDAKKNTSKVAPQVMGAAEKPPLTLNSPFTVDEMKKSTLPPQAKANLATAIDRFCKTIFSKFFWSGNTAETKSVRKSVIKTFFEKSALPTPTNLGKRPEDSMSEFNPESRRASESKSKFLTLPSAQQRSRLKVSSRARSATTPILDSESTQKDANESTPKNNTPK